MYFGISIILIFFGAIINASGGLWASFKENKRFKYWPPILIFIGLISSAAGAVFNAKSEARFEHQLRKKTEEIVRLSSNTLNVVTGGDSIGFFTSYSIDEQNDKIRLIFRHEKGKYPLYDVNVYIKDLEKLDEIKEQKEGELRRWRLLEKKPFMQRFVNFFKAHTVKFIGTLAPYQSIPVELPLERRKKLRFDISITARNGVLRQNLVIIFDGQFVKGATQVWKESVEEPIYERIDPGFPREKSGQIKW